MRIEVISDGESLGRFEFICQPKPGELIETEAGTFEAKEFRHNLKSNRLEAWCTKRTPVATDRPLSSRQKPQHTQAAPT